MRLSKISQKILTVNTFVSRYYRSAQVKHKNVSNRTKNSLNHSFPCLLLLLLVITENNTQFRLNFTWALEGLPPNNDTISSVNKLDDS